jgi:hypothetical protein
VTDAGEMIDSSEPGGPQFVQACTLGFQQHARPTNSWHVEQYLKSAVMRSSPRPCSSRPAPRTLTRRPHRSQ